MAGDTGAEQSKRGKGTKWLLRIGFAAPCVGVASFLIGAVVFFHTKIEIVVVFYHIFVSGSGLPAGQLSDALLFLTNLFVIYIPPVCFLAGAVCSLIALQRRDRQTAPMLALLANAAGIAIWFAVLFQSVSAGGFN